MKKQLQTLKLAIILLGLVISTTANAFTAVTSGNWSNAATWGGVAPGPNVSGQDINIPLGITVTLDQDVTFSGLLNTFLVDGELSSTSNNWVMISSGTMAGDGSVMIDKLTFTGALTACTFSGDMMLRMLENQTLSLGITATIDVADTLVLESGAININTDGNFTMASNSVIRINDGSITVGGGILNLTNMYNVYYEGTSKTTGIELNSSSLNHIDIDMDDNTQVVSLGTDADINGMLHVWSGRFGLNGTHLTLTGNVIMEDNTRITTTAASQLSVEGSGNTLDTLMFASGSTISSINIDRSGGTVIFGGDLTVSNTVNLMNGVLEIRSDDLTVAAGCLIHKENGSLTENGGMFDGTNSYNVEFMASTTINTGIEIHGSGLNNVTVDMQLPINEVILDDSMIVSGMLDMANGKLRISNEVLVLNGTYSAVSSAKLLGNSVSELHLNLTSVTNDTIWFDQTANGLAKLVVNTTGDDVVLGSDLQVFESVTFSSGKLVVYDGKLMIKPTANVYGFDDNMYFVTEGTNASVEMNVNSGSAFVTFPVGTEDNYSPAYIQQTASGTSGNFNVRVQNQVLSNATFGFVSSSISKVVDRTWFINSDATTVNSNIKLGWVSAAELNGFDRTNAYITHYSGTGWDVMAPSSAVTSTNNTYELTRNGITNLDPAFAVTEDGEPIKIDEVVAPNEIRIFPNPATEYVVVETGSKADKFNYELTDLTGRTIKTTRDGTNKFYVKDLNDGCYFIKATNLNTKEVLVKRIIKD